ncbi:hypothetical protein M231_02143 [Tremella mesenterica]|uniref:Extradiol ring-cleavage dioxygenase class III enzyme subunit B domain-containing protein n=1 Tax=Tremella mesenterica TaxID=5217 RepID=A0A4Q1BR96_TREME|nr:hypothetical protein M231_02143 [Tremella mesenterica]
MKICFIEGGTHRQAPSSMFEKDSKPYEAWQKVGKEIQASNPRGLVVVSAHWENEAGSEGVRVNTDTTNPLIYDFYNFPPHFYEQKFTSHGDAKLVEVIKQALKSAALPYDLINRGIDHGVWVPFKVAFAGETQIPLVQVSLPGDGQAISAAKLGKALAPLREQGYAIIASGQAVHNLRDFFSGRGTAYTRPFLDAITHALTSPKPLETTLTLFRHPLYKSAHPTPEHLLPLAVAVAAAGHDQVEEMFVSDDGLGWGMWRWH